MGDKVYIVKRGDFNKDGYEDRITQDFQCRQKRDGDFVCENYNIELGQPGGKFIKVFNPDALADPEPLKEGDSVYYTPRFFRERGQYSDKYPGQKLDFRVGAQQSHTPYLSTEQLEKLCDESFSRGSEDRFRCFTAARGDPEGHDFQPWTTSIPKGSDEVQFEFHPGKHDMPPAPLPRRFVIKATSSALTSEFKNFLRAERIRKKGLTLEEKYPNGENPYLSPAGILWALENLRAQGKFFLYTGIERQMGVKLAPITPIINQNPDSDAYGTPVGRHLEVKAAVRSLERNQYFAKKHLENLAKFKDLDVGVLFGLVDFLRKALNDRAGNSAVFSGEALATAATILETEFAKPENLKPLVAYILKKEATEDIRLGNYWPFRMKHIVPVLQKQLVTIQDRNFLPPNEDLLKLGKVEPRVAGQALLAMAKHGREFPAAASLVDRLVKSPQIRDKILAAVAIPVLLKEKAVGDLIRLCEDKDPEVRLVARQSLMKAPPPTKLWEAEYLRIFREGLEDDDLRIRVLSAEILITVGDREVAELLYEKLKNYHADPLYLTRWDPPIYTKPILDPKILAAGLKAACAKPDARGRHCNPHKLFWEIQSEMTVETYDPVMSAASFNLRKEFLEKHKMELGITFPSEDGEPKRPVTLKTLTLIAIGKFGGPPQAADLLRKIVDEEKDPVDLLLASQSLVRLKGRGALPDLLARLKKGAPDPLFVMTIQVIHQGKVKKLAPMLYSLLQHPSKMVRQASITALYDLERNAILYALLRDSKDQKPEIRLKVAEALGIYQVEPSVKRLIEMVKDPDEEVQRQAALSLSQMKEAEAREVIEEAIKKDPALRERLGVKVADKGEGRPDRESSG